MGNYADMCGEIKGIMCACGRKEPKFMTFFNEIDPHTPDLGGAVDP